MSCAASRVEPAPRVLVKTEAVRPDIPPVLTDCSVPIPEQIKTMGDVKAYVAELHRQAMACEQKSRAVRGIVN